jgi:hypothetical protein
MELPGLDRGTQGDDRVHLRYWSLDTLYCNHIAYKSWYQAILDLIR